MSVWVYDVLLRLLFVLHAAFAAFVAGGTGWLTFRGVRGLFAGPAAGGPPDGDTAAGDTAAGDTADATLRDWLPFALGLAITFGVGPLLFVQLQHGESFYTANLLLSHRFMALLPALIVGFYLLYLQKTSWRFVRSRLGRLAVPGAALLCFGFAAWSWSENHLLAHDPAAWPELYAAGPGFFAHPDLVARLTVFAGLAAQAAATGVALLAAGRVAARRLAAVGATGVALVLLGIAVHPPVPGVGAGRGAVGLALGVEVLLLGVWIAAGRRGTVPRVLATGLLVLVFERVAATREAVRLARGGADAFGETASAQGFAVFAASLAAVALAIAWTARRVARDLKAV